MIDNSKTLLAQAAEIVAASGVDVTKKVEIYPLACILREQSGCSLQWARDRIAKAVRRARHPLNEAAKRGGAGRGQGRKPGQAPVEAIAARKTKHQKQVE